MFSLLIKIKNIILDIFFPSICLYCRKPLIEKDQAGVPEKLICNQCLSLIKINNTLFCPLCRARLADNKRICHHSYNYNDNSGKKRSFYYFLASAGDYDNPLLQNLIHCFKYKYFKNLAPILGNLLIKYLQSLSENWNLKIGNFIIVPIPLHFRRERQRGFNQAKLIAEVVARHYHLSLVDNLKRIKNNKPQAELKESEARLKNVANCFKIINPDLVQGKNIILVDDVFTSGATMKEAVKTLKENGAKKIIALVIAKA